MMRWCAGAVRSAKQGLPEDTYLNIYNYSQKNALTNSIDTKTAKCYDIGVKAMKSLKHP